MIRLAWKVYFCFCISPLALQHLFNQLAWGVGQALCFPALKVYADSTRRFRQFYIACTKTLLQQHPVFPMGGGSFEFLCFCIFCVFVFQYTSFITRVEIQFQAFQGGYIFVFLCFCVFVFHSFTLVPATPGLSKRG